MGVFATKKLLYGESSNLNHNYGPKEENKLERHIISDGLKRIHIKSLNERPSSKSLHSYFELAFKIFFALSWLSKYFIL